MPKKENQFDPNYRPNSYWKATDPLQAVLEGIAGTARRNLIKAYWEAGGMEHLDDKILKNMLTEKERDELGRMHPYFLGGEFLSMNLPGEVCVVRIELQSTTFDVIELRARPLPDNTIGLRWSDEYQTEFHAPYSSIQQPFSFTELVSFINNSYSEESPEPITTAYLSIQTEPGELEQLEFYTKFITFSSDFYPPLSHWATAEVTKWYWQRKSSL
jgi:hypothetical protein